MYKKLKEIMLNLREINFYMILKIEKIENDDPVLVIASIIEKIILVIFTI